MVNGIWDLSVMGTPMGKVDMMLKLVLADDVLTGTITGPGGKSTEIKNATMMAENKVRFSAVVNTPNGPTGITVNLTISDDQAVGQVSAGMAGPFDVRGTKRG